MEGIVFDVGKISEITEKGQQMQFMNAVRRQLTPVSSFPSSRSVSVRSKHCEYVNNPTHLALYFAASYQVSKAPQSPLV